MQKYLVEIFSEKELKELLDDLYMDDTVDILEELPANLVNRILDTVSTFRPRPDQPAPELSGRQRRKHYDHRICGHP